MALVTGVSLPADGQVASTTDYNAAINKILVAINGGIDDANVSDNSLTEGSLDPSAQASSSIGDIIADYVATGGVWTVTAGLTGTMTEATVYIDGAGYTVPSVVAKIFPASQDTYIDVGTNLTVDYTSLGVGAAAPALAASHVRLALVTTDGSDILNINQLGNDEGGTPLLPAVASTGDPIVQYFPAGIIQPWGGTTGTTPAGWLACDGASVKTYEYPALYAAIGFTHGGSGEDFTLPDLAGKNVMGYDSGDTDFDAEGETGGVKDVTLTAAQSGEAGHNHIQNSHNHTATQGSHTHSVSLRYIGDVGTGGDLAQTGAGSVWNNLATVPINAASAGTITVASKTPTNQAVAAAPAAEAHSVLNPYIALSYIIKAV